MDSQNFWEALHRRIAKYDLLCHPFYKAWSAGELTRDDLRDYAANYYHHVAAFPGYLGIFASRLGDAALAETVLTNKQDEDGVGLSDERSHAQLWLDFAEAMGAQRNAVPKLTPLAEVSELIAGFDRIAREGLPAEVLAAFYAYESQVPRLATEKARGLREMYAADMRATRYFDVHITADAHHALVWREQLQSELQLSGDELPEKALASAERAAKALWKALDGIERERLAHRDA